jgi:hypothetical protein
MGRSQRQRDAGRQGGRYEGDGFSHVFVLWIVHWARLMAARAF